MTSENIAHRETTLIETLLSGLDARASAQRSGSSMLIYLAEMIVLRAREELAELKSRHPLSAEETDADTARVQCDGRASGAAEP